MAFIALTAIINYMYTTIDQVMLFINALIISTLTIKLTKPSYRLMEEKNLKLLVIKIDYIINIATLNLN